MADKVDKKEPLTVELLQVGDFLFGRIKDQDESLRTTTVTFEHDKVTIMNGSQPQIYMDGCKKLFLYIRGNDRRSDHMTFMYRFKNEKEAAKWGLALKEAIEAFNKDPGLINEPPTETLRCKRILN